MHSCKRLIEDNADLFIVWFLHEAHDFRVLDEPTNFKRCDIIMDINA